jgi:hypothetical protein
MGQATTCTLLLKGQCPRICFVKYPASHLGYIFNYMYRKIKFVMRFIEDLECIFFQRVYLLTLVTLVSPYEIRLIF